MNFQNLMQKYRYFNSKNEPVINTNNQYSVKYVMPIINAKEKEFYPKKKSLTTILNIDTNLDYDYEKQVIQEKIAEQVSYQNQIVEEKNVEHLHFLYLSQTLNQSLSQSLNPKCKYITLFFGFGIFIFSFYKYIYII